MLSPKATNANLSALKALDFVLIAFFSVCRFKSQLKKRHLAESPSNETQIGMTWRSAGAELSAFHLMDPPLDGA